MYEINVFLMLCHMNLRLEFYKEPRTVLILVPSLY